MAFIRAVWPLALTALIGIAIGAPSWGDAAAAGASGAPAVQADAPPPPPEAEPQSQPGEQAPSARGGRYLQLPDISFIAGGTGKLSDDRRDGDRDRIGLDEAELGIQSYVYPHIRADAFLVAPGDEEFKVELEEGYITHEQLPLRFTGRLGKFFVPFGRDNQKHPHSWLYARRPLVWRNLVSTESLTGNGINLSWLAPTHNRLFLQLDAGAYSRTGNAHADGEGAEGSAQPEVPIGAGASFADKFYTARAWAGMPVGNLGEFELGGSWARGSAEPVQIAEGVTSGRNLQVTGMDASYRAYGKGARRLLVRGEYLWHRYKSSLGRDRTEGYYALANYRWSKHFDVGMLYDWSEMPELAAQHESALSAIFTRQFTEQTYARIQLTRGSRPGKEDYSEAWLQLIWGMGPHTHQLE